MTKRSTYVYIALLLILIVVCIVGVVGYYVYLENTANTVSNDPYSTLMNSSPAFLSGEQFFAENNAAEALKQYENALSLAQNKQEVGLIKNKIAALKERTGDVAGAISISKEVAADGEYGDLSRAYAVQFMGQQLSNPQRSPAERKSIAEEIFKDEPYKGLASTTDDSVSYRNLFEYAASIYPLALSELRSAYWYADAVFSLKQKTSLGAGDKGTVEKYLQIISRKVMLANADIARIEGITGENNEYRILPVSFIREALINTRVSQAGEKYDGMTTPESIYEEALSYVRSRQMVGDEATVQYSYAIYLANTYGETKKDKIASLLNDFYISGRFASTSTATLFENEKANDIVTNKNITLLAEIDAGFKGFLQKKGWKF